MAIKNYSSGAQVITSRISQQRAAKAQPAGTPPPRNVRKKKKYLVKRGDNPVTISQNVYGNTSMAQAVARANPNIDRYQAGTYVNVPDERKPPTFLETLLKNLAPVLTAGQLAGGALGQIGASVDQSATEAVQGAAAGVRGLDWPVGKALGGVWDQTRGIVGDEFQHLIDAINQQAAVSRAMGEARTANLSGSQVSQAVGGALLGQGPATGSVHAPGGLPQLRHLQGTIAGQQLSSPATHGLAREGTSPALQQPGRPVHPGLAREGTSPALSFARPRTQYGPGSPAAASTTYDWQYLHMRPWDARPAELLAQGQTPYMIPDQDVLDFGLNPTLLLQAGYEYRSDIGAYVRLQPGARTVASSSGQQTASGGGYGGGGGSSWVNYGGGGNELFPGLFGNRQSIQPNRCGLGNLEDMMLYRIEARDAKGQLVTYVWGEDVQGALDILERMHPGAVVSRLDVAAFDFVLWRAGELVTFSTGEKLTFEPDNLGTVGHGYKM